MMQNSSTESTGCVQFGMQRARIQEETNKAMVATSIATQRLAAAMRIAV